MKSPTKEGPHEGGSRLARRFRFMRRFQHDFLDLLLAEGPSLAVVLTDNLGNLPPDITRRFVGQGVRDLAADGMIRKVSPIPAVVRQGGRHAQLHFLWALAVESAEVEEWKKRNPVPPVPKTDVTGSATS